METLDILMQKNIAPTQLRIAILELLAKANQPLSYDEILKSLKANKTSIYRNMQLFESCGLINKSEFGRKGYYELFKSDKAYFVCNVCHEMHKVALPALSGDVVTSAVFKGVCKGCLG